MQVKIIISGGQTGADRAALDFARTYEIPCIGFCPAGRRSEDGPIPGEYPLVPTAQPDYATRTKMNILLADATLIFTRTNPVSAGSSLTARICHEYAKPFVIIDTDLTVESQLDAARAILTDNVHSINIAGNRLSVNPDVERYVHRFLSFLWSFDSRD